MSEAVAIKLLMLLFQGFGMLESALEWERPPWSTVEGKVEQGELIGMNWEARMLVIRTVDDQMWTVAAKELSLSSKVRMLASPTFQAYLANHQAELEAQAGWRWGLEEMERLSLIWMSCCAAGFLAMHWFLSGWILQDGGIMRWLLGIVAFVVVSACSAGLYWVLQSRLGGEQWTEYLLIVGGAHTVCFLSAIWWIYRAGPFRSVAWYVLSWGAAAILPIALLAVGGYGQVLRYAGEVNEAAFDKYLTEVWLIPMGIL
ncbi:MAG: hypothetical protein AAGJ31_05495 [Verrucomicrobiota bacterium]